MAVATDSNGEASGSVQRPGIDGKGWANIVSGLFVCVTQTPDICDPTYGAMVVKPS